VSNLYFTRVK